LDESFVAPTDDKCEWPHAIDLRQHLSRAMTRDASAPTMFLLVTFAHLKGSKFHYLFVFPTFANQTLWEIDDDRTVTVDISDTENSWRLK